MEQSIGIGKYILRFALAHLALLVGLGILSTILGIDSSTGATMGALLGAAIIAVSKFIQDNRRVPTKEEKRKLVWFSYIASWIVSLLLFAVLISFVEGGDEIMQIIPEIGAPLIIGVTAFLTLFYVGVLYFAYGFIANKQLEVLHKKGKL